MATKAELEAELADLRKQLADGAKQAAQDASTEAPAAFSDMLKSQGLTVEDISTLWQQFARELGNLPQNKPLITAIAAFGIGFMLGRMGRS